MKNKLTQIIFYIFTITAIFAGIAFAVDKLIPTESPVPTMVTLEDIYQKVAGINGTATPHSISTSSSPVNSMHSLQDIWNIMQSYTIPDSGDVATGTTYGNSSNLITGILESCSSFAPAPYRIELTRGTGINSVYDVQQTGTSSWVVNGWSSSLDQDMVKFTVTDVENGTSTITINGGQQPNGEQFRIISTDDISISVVTGMTGYTDVTRVFTVDVNPVTVPGAPTIDSVTSGNTSASIAFTPTTNGWSNITSYTVTCVEDPTKTTTSASSPITVSGLTNGEHYTFVVKATNGVGAGPNSEPSVTVTPNPTVPGAPSLQGATAASERITINYTAPESNGGSAITGYKIYRGTVLDGATSFIADAGLALTYTDEDVNNGTAYYYQVAAVNEFGVGPKQGTVSQTPVGPGNIGESYLGGKVAYIDGTGKHGFIVNLLNWPAETQWDCRGETIGTSEALGSGYDNTQLMHEHGCMTGAGLEAITTTDGGAWYVPSWEELKILHANREAIGGFSLRGYWSSSEDDSTHAWMTSFNNSDLMYFAIGKTDDGIDTTAHNKIRLIKSF